MINIKDIRDKNPGTCCTYDHRNQKQAITAGDAEARFVRAGFTPRPGLPYPGYGTGWTSTCPQGHEVSPSLRNITTRGFCCKECADVARWNGRRIPAHEAAELMEANDFHPLDQYTNSGARWKSLCLRKQAIVFPTYDNVRGHGHTCSACRTRGVAWDAPTMIYVLVHEAHEALKVGIAKRDIARGTKPRVATLCRNHGWTFFGSLVVPTGRIAFGVEQQVIDWLQNSGYDRRYLTADDTEGHTETFSREAGPSRVFAKIKELVRNLSDNAATDHR